MQSDDRIDRDFKRYLSSLTVPYCVKDFVRKGQKRIDELYLGKDRYFADKRRLLFYSFLVRVFWGGSVSPPIHKMASFISLNTSILAPLISASVAPMRLSP